MEGERPAELAKEGPIDFQDIAGGFRTEARHRNLGRERSGAEHPSPTYPNSGIAAIRVAPPAAAA